MVGWVVVAVWIASGVVTALALQEAHRDMRRREQSRLPRCAECYIPKDESNVDSRPAKGVEP